MTTQFHLDGIHNRVLGDWGRAAAREGIAARTLARRHAAANGAAGLWLASGNLLLFYREHDGSVRQRTFKGARPIFPRQLAGA